MEERLGKMNKLVRIKLKQSNTQNIKFEICTRPENKRLYSMGNWGGYKMKETDSKYKDKAETLLETKRYTGTESDSE